ncbi:MAG TPA: noncanonical pyrimidine nucleotidase, YjjG family [Bacteroidales bacterium]|nr:noncanonical pyrimidine nucleotidase, YjjG family [Bacteroidales bacterium]
MKHYKHIFFDLDRTLYDFDQNNRNTLKEIYTIAAKDHKDNGGFEKFLNAYKIINKGLWQKYKNKEISKEQLNHSRFSQTLQQTGYDPNMAQNLADAYIRLSPFQVQLMPHCIEILDYLCGKYALHIITNGFSEIQFQKLERCRLSAYFQQILVSEEAGAQKPEMAIFDLAFSKTGATPQNSLIVGDDPQCDILGGMNAGMDQVWLFQPGETSEYKPTFAISSLLQLKDIL